MLLPFCPNFGQFVFWRAWKCPSRKCPTEQKPRKCPTPKSSQLKMSKWVKILNPSNCKLKTGTRPMGVGRITNDTCSCLLLIWFWEDCSLKWCSAQCLAKFFSGLSDVRRILEKVVGKTVFGFDRFSICERKNLY